MYLSKEQVRTMIQNAPPGTTPQGILSGLRNKGIALEGYDATFATSHTPKTMMDTFSEGVNSLYAGFSNLPVIKQGSQVVGAVTGLAAAIPSALVNIPGELAVESAKLAAGKGFSLQEAAARGTKSVQDAYKFGQELGTAAVPAFASGGLGKAVQVVLGVSMTYEGQKNLREGIASGDYEKAAVGATQLIPGLLGLKSSAGSALGDVRAGFTPKTPGESVTLAQGLKASAGNLSKDLFLAPELKSQVAREYRYLRYGADAPVLGAGDIRTLNSAIKPSKSKLTLPQWSKDLETTIHAVSDSLPENPTIVDLDTAIKNEKASTWADVKDSIKKGDEAKLALDGDAIASAIRERKNDPRMQLENVRYVRDAITGDMVRAETGPLREIEDLAKAYEGKNIDFLSGEAVLESLNAESQMYYKKNMTSRSVAERADPVLAAKLDLAAEIRKQQDALLESIDVSGFKGLKRKYGALRNVGEEVQNRMFMDSKLQMSSLAQKIAAGRQAAQMIYGAATGNPAAALSGIADKVLTDYVKSLDEASSKIGRVFDSVRRNKELNAMPSLLESAKDIKPGLTVEDVSGRPGNTTIDMGKQVLPKAETGLAKVITPSEIAGKLETVPVDIAGDIVDKPVNVIEEYKGKKIVMDSYGLVNVYDPKEKTMFIVALDDSKLHGDKTIVDEANNVANARDHIDHVEESRKGKTLARDIIDVKASDKKTEKPHKERLYHGTNDISWVREGRQIKRSETGTIGHGGVFFEKDPKSAEKWITASGGYAEKKASGKKGGVVILEKKMAENFNLKKITQAEYEKAFFKAMDALRTHPERYGLDKYGVNEGNAWNIVEKNLISEGYDGVDFGQDGVIFDPTMIKATEAPKTIDKGEEFFHGTWKENLDSFRRHGFDISKNKKGFAEAPFAFFVAKSEKDAGMYGNTTKVVTKEKLRVLDQSSREWADTMGESMSAADTERIAKELKAMGYDAIDSGNELMVLSPEKFKVSK